MTSAPFSLRPGGGGDRELLRRVHREAMGPHVVATYGAWDDAAQRRRFDESTDPAAHEVVECEGRPVGCQWVRRHPDALELVRLWLLPEAQGRGLGTALVARLCARADAERLPVRLRVLRVNQARRLYERAGFTVVGETETHFRMRREPRARGGPCGGARVVG